MDAEGKFAELKKRGQSLIMERGPHLKSVADEALDVFNERSIRGVVKEAEDVLGRGDDSGTVVVQWEGSSVGPTSCRGARSGPCINREDDTQLSH